MKVSVVQTNPAFGQVSANIEQAIRLMKSTPADLYVLPEMFASGYNFIDLNEARSLAQPFRSGEIFISLADFSKKHRCTIVYGFNEIENDTLYNSSGLISHDGTIALYRKIHLFDREKLTHAPGNLPFTVTKTPVGYIGMMICFDWYFPESARTLALRGAEIIAHPSNLVLPHCPDSMPVRCRENRVFAATANRVGEEHRGGINLTYIGRSQIVAPIGDILVRASDSCPEILVQEVDVSITADKNVTKRNHLLNDRRPEFYQ